MKKLLGIAVAVAVLAGVAAVYAGDAGCCAAGKAKSASAGCSSACSKMLSKLNLTSDQQTRIAALNQQLRTATSKIRAHCDVCPGHAADSHAGAVRAVEVRFRQDGEERGLPAHDDTDGQRQGGLIDLAIDRKTPARCAGVFLFGVARHPLTLTLTPTFVGARGTFLSAACGGEAQVRW